MVKIKNKHHLEILKELARKSRKISKKEREFVKRYMGTDKTYHALAAKDKEKITKKFLKDHSDLSPKEFILLLNSLYQGKSHQEISMAGKLLEFSPKFKESFDIKLLNNWLNNTKGWGEVDSLCQSNFSAKNILESWEKWESLLTKFSKDKNIHKRRASLVLLTKAVRQSSDKKLLKIALISIERLKGEKDVLITKAVSWLLRSLVSKNKSLVRDYLEENKNSLPKIAVRETENKIKTGKKSKIS